MWSPASPERLPSQVEEAGSNHNVTQSTTTQVEPAPNNYYKRMVRDVVRHADVLSAIKLQRIVAYVCVNVVLARVVITGGGGGGAKGPHARAIRTRGASADPAERGTRVKGRGHLQARYKGL